MNRTNTAEEIDYILTELELAVEKLRSLSPIWREKAAA
jgi:cysteine sulfinate desulfinase/cysteine desulfurase-like protein